MDEHESQTVTSAGHTRPPRAETGVLPGVDNVALFTQTWHPPGVPRSSVVLVHGYGDHSGRFEHVATALAAAGHTAYAFDLRGHGRSDGRRGTVRRFDRYIDDLGRLIDRVRNETPPERPLFLFGHSMGGAVCALYWLERRPAINGLILSSPLFRLGADFPRVPTWLTTVPSRVLPQFPTFRIDLRHLTHDPDVVAQTARDPLYLHRHVPLRMGHEMTRAGERILDRVESFTVPFLVFHGTADRITDPTASAELYRRARSDDKTFGLYEGLYHETLNEPEHAHVLAALLAWLDEHAPKSA